MTACKAQTTGIIIKRKLSLRYYRRGYTMVIEIMSRIVYKMLYVTEISTVINQLQFTMFYSRIEIIYVLAWYIV